ncbi:hypothetical protein [Alkalilimnicola ehrlichii]
MRRRRRMKRLRANRSLPAPG